MTQSLQVVDGTHGVFFARRGDLITSQLVRFGSHAGGELAMLLETVMPGDVIVDIGAHIGTFVIPLARAVGPTGRVIGFEPFVPSYRVLELNVEMNGVAGVATTRPLAIAPPGAAWTTVTPDEGNTGGTYLTSAENGPIAAIGLDEWLDRNQVEEVDLIKIDTEGMECLVLSTAVATIGRCRPIIYAEVAASMLERFGGSVSWLEDLFRDNGYRLFRNVGQRQTSGDEYQLIEIETLDVEDFFDVLAVPSDRMHRIESKANIS